MRPVRNTLLSAIVTGSRVASVAVTMLCVARALGPAGFGTFTYALTLATVLAVVPDYGFSLQLVARIAAAPERARALLRSATHAKCYLVVAAAGLGALWLLIRLPSGTTLQMLVLLFSSAIVLSFGQLNSYAFRGIDRFDLDAISSAALNTALVVGVLFVVWKGGGAVGIAWVYLAVRSLYLALTIILVRKLPPDRRDGSEISPPRMLWEGASYGIHTAIGVLCLNLDSLILAAYKGEAALGYYQAGMRLVFAAALVPEVLISGLFPTIARSLARGERAQAVRIGAKMHRYLLLSGAAGAAILLIMPGVIRQALYGPSYVAVDPWLPWFGVAIFVRYASATYGMSITAAGAQGNRTLAVVAATVLSAAGNFLLIPRYGVAGAIAALIITQASLLLAYAVLARHALGEWLIDKRTTLGLGILSALTLASLPAVTAAPRAAAVACPLVIAACALWAAVPKHEWRHLIASITPG